MSKRITIKSIANDLGISHMTVSRALSGNPNVQKATREAVLQRAQEVGYVRSAAANAMRGDKTNIVGLLLPNIVNEFYARFSDSLALDCEKRGLQLIIHLTNDDVIKEQQAILRLQEVQASAVVMVPTPGVLKDEKKLVQGLKVIQLIRYRRFSEPYPCVLVEDSAAISDAVEHLVIKGGHSRIAYIGGESTLSSGAGRLSAFLSGLRNVGVEPNPEDIFVAKPNFAMGHGVTESIIKVGKPTAIVCGGVEISNGALSACLEHGLNLPGDIAFVGYGDPSYYQWINGGISTIQIPVHELALATARLLGSAEEDEAAALHQILPARFIIRSSSN